ncbi:hypothetical protein HYT23_05410, partial [Candidatus Pacearchaeota archaeon]|nr:hypothetical protein [Candidatus Pacearchaeota archaeon]
MGLIKNKKAVIKASITIFSLLAISAVIAFATGVFAFTHDSTANITPDLVQASTQYNFAVEVSNLLSSEDPVSEFRIYMESSGSNPNPFTNIVCNSKSGWNGPFIISSSEGDYCLYTAQSVSDRIFPGESEDFSFDAESPRTGSCRTFKFETRDPDQFWRPIEDEVCVDNQAPVTTKQFEGPQKIENGVEWIDGISTIVLTAEDPQPHPAGVDETFYKLSGPVDDSYCYNSCDEWQTSSPDGEGWYEYSEPLGDIEESCHVLEFYSTDNLGNVEDVNANCFFVDKTPPIVRKDVGRPQVPCESESECDYYISSETDITLTCEDVGPHPSDDVTIYWRYRVDNEGNGFGDDSWTDEFSENSEEAVFSFPEPSMHELEYWCVDAVEKESQHLFEIDKVDNEAPVITKEMIGEHHLGQCPPRPNTDDECYVADNRENGVSISVEDPNQNHAVNGVSCNYELWWKTDLETCIREFDGTHLYNPDTGQCFVEGSPFEYSKDIIFTEDSTHTLKIWCEDALGNEVYDEEDFLVDSAPPETSKAYGTPAYPADINTGGQYPHYITSQTPITLTAADAKVGVNKTYYRTTLVDDRYCFTEYSGCQNYDGEINEQFVEYTNPFTMEQSCHLIEFYSVDKLGNEEEINRQCVFVDNTAPEGSKEVGSPSIEIEEGNLIDWYVNTQTPIYLSCEDQEPHPVNHETVYWRFSWWPQGFDGPVEYSEWFSDEDGETIVYFEEDSWHDLEFYCEDALGNKGEIDLEYFVVDSQPPEIEKEIVGPYVMCSEDVDGEDGSDGDNGEEQVNSVGDEIDTITFPEGADTGVGVAFDGEFLYYTYIDSKNLYKIRPDGSGHEVITTSGISETGLGALSYDATRDKIWAGTYGCDKDNGGPVYLIDKETGEATYMFSVPSTYITYCLDDGIAFDASDDSIWYSDDIADTMVHMNTDGTFLGTVDLDTIHPDLADNSGIAIGGDNFYLGTDGHETTIRVDRDTLAILDTFVNTNFRIEDMECDPNTYSPIEVMWIRDAYAGQVRAYEIEPATCGLGGEEPEPKQDCFIIDGVTEIHVDASDPEPHPVGDVTCEWGYTWDEEFYGWFEEDELPFVISGWDESKHDLEINCWDGLGNEIRDIETFLVDKTPPGIDKKYGEPYFSWQFDDYWAEWISSQTPIQISVVDEGPHLSGIKEVKYRTSIVE